MPDDACDDGYCLCPQQNLARAPESAARRHCLQNTDMRLLYGYIAYLRAQKYNVTELNFEEKWYMAKKRILGVPASLDSCHTTVIEEGKYFVEGHVPYEAINKLIADKPKIGGISLPGMPSASPGMPGGKTAPFSVKQVSPDGVISLYLTL